MNTTTDASTLMTTAEFCKMAHLPWADAKQLIADKGIQPALVGGSPRKPFLYYASKDLLPIAADLAKAYRQRKADRMQAIVQASAAVAQPVVADNCDGALAKRLDAMAESLVLIGTAIDALKAQQQQILDAITSPEPAL